MKRLSSKLVILLALVFCAVCVPSAYAGTVGLTLTAGSDTVTILDGSALDGDPTTGVVVFIGSVDGWTINVTTGESPYPGKLLLNSLDISVQNSGVGTLSILF